MYLLEQQKTSQIRHHSICRISNYPLNNKDCSYLTKIIRFLSLTDVTRLIGRLKTRNRFDESNRQSLIVNINHTAVDLYSIDDFYLNRIGSQWTKSGNCLNMSSGLSYIEQTFVISGKHLHERQMHLRNVFERHSIDHRSIHWRSRWDQALCNSEAGQREMLQKMNLLGIVFYCCRHQ